MYTRQREIDTPVESDNKMATTKLLAPSLPAVETQSTSLHSSPGLSPNPSDILASHRKYSPCGATSQFATANCNMSLSASTMPPKTGRVYTSSGDPHPNWHLTYDRCVKQLSASERQQFQNADRFEDVQKSLVLLRGMYDASRSMNCLGKIEPFLEALRSFGTIIDVYCNAKPEVLSLLWGSVRMILEASLILFHLRKGHGEVGLTEQDLAKCTSS